MSKTESFNTVAITFLKYKIKVKSTWKVVKGETLDVETWKGRQFIINHIYVNNHIVINKKETHNTLNPYFTFISQTINTYLGTDEQWYPKTLKPFHHPLPFPLTNNNEILLNYKKID